MLGFFVRVQRKFEFHTDSPGTKHTVSNFSAYHHQQRQIIIALVSSLVTRSSTFYWYDSKNPLVLPYQNLYGTASPSGRRDYWKLLGFSLSGEFYNAHFAHAINQRNEWTNRASLNLRGISQQNLMLPKRR
jgi:hypothetical protein